MSKSTFDSIESHPNYIAVVSDNALKEVRIGELEEEKAKYLAQIDSLSHNIDLLKKALYAPKSEKHLPELDARQAKLFETELSSRPVVSESPEVEIEPRPRKKRKRYVDQKGNETHFPANLPREEIVLTPEGSLKCEECDKDKVRFRLKLQKNSAWCLPSFSLKDSFVQFTDVTAEIVRQRARTRLTALYQRRCWTLLF